MSDFNGEEFEARGYAVSTVGFGLEAVQRYVREQGAGDAAGHFERAGWRLSFGTSVSQSSRTTAFEAVTLTKPPASPGVSDSQLLSDLIDRRTIAWPRNGFAGSVSSLQPSGLGDLHLFQRF